MNQGDKLHDLEATARGEGAVAESVRQQLDAERPRLSTYETMVWEAFWFLGTSRPNGMGMNGIPMAAIREYVDWCDMPRAMGEMFIIEINAMDRTYVNTKNTEASKSSK